MTDKPASQPSTLHGILVELGIAPPEPLEDLETHPERRWNVDEVFIPKPGLRYELVLAAPSPAGSASPVRIKLQTHGVQPADWIDLDTGQPLDAAHQAMPVRAFRLLD